MPVSPVRVLTAQQLGAFGKFPRLRETDITLTFLGGA